ncbi:MAG: iron-sulfur cluster assembly scaffold protein, partial [Pseudomonadota bacterium]
MTDPYNDRVRELFADPAHAGDLDNAATGWFEDQGIRIRLAAETENGVLTKLRFRAYGCPHVLAACEAVCRQYEGQAIAALEAFKSGQIMADLAALSDRTVSSTTSIRPVFSAGTPR